MPKDQDAVVTEAGAGIEPAEALGPPTEWEGEWSMVAAVFNGGTIGADAVRGCTRVTRGDVTTIRSGPQVTLKARFTLDPSMNPGSVEYLNLEGALSKKPQSGIYELRGDLLRICMSAPKKPRASDFSSTSGDGRSLTTWRLEKK